jgi:hypothetical protein
VAELAANADVLLQTQANDFVGGLSFGGALGNIRDVALRNVDAGATVPNVSGLSGLRNLSLQFDNAGAALGGVSATGNLTVNVSGAITQTGSLQVVGPASFNTGAAPITLTNGGNNLIGVVALNNSGANDVSVTTVGLNLGPSTIGRNLTVTTDNFTGSGAVSVPGTLRIQPRTSTTNIRLGAPAAGGFTGIDLDATQLGRISAQTLLIGSATASGQISTGGAVTLPGNVNLTLLAGGGGGTIMVTNPLTLSGSGALTLNANTQVTILAGVTTASGAISIGGLTALGAGVATSGAPISFLSDVGLAGGGQVSTASGAPLGNDIHFFGNISGPTGTLALAAGSNGNLTFDGTVGGGGALGSVTIASANTVAANGAAFATNNLNITAQNITGTYNPTNTTGVFYPIPFTFNAPHMNANGTVYGVGGAAAAAMIASPYDVNPTFTQFFNGVSVGPLPPVPPAPPPPPPPLPSTTIDLLNSVISNSVATSAAFSTGVVIGRQITRGPSLDDTSGVGFSGDVSGGGSGFEVGISAHNVDWDEPVADLPIKPQDFLIDLEEFFSGKRAR